MINLRPYQIQTISEIKEVFSKGLKSVLAVCPTGGGKTTIAAEMIRKANEKGSHILFLAHRSELITQAHSRLREFGMYAGVIMGKHKFKGDRINVASIQTLQRAKALPKADLIFVDEAHHSSSESIKKILSFYPNAYIVGLTATPERLDGKPLSDIYNGGVVENVTINDLIEIGFLVPPKYYAAKDSINTEELDKMKTSMGEYNAKELYNSFDKPKLYHGVVEKYQEICNHKKAIIFCINCEHSRKTAEEFTNAGYKAAHLDGDCSDLERKTTLAKFAKGEIMILCNVQILTEGFDQPDIEVVILNRATKSTSLYFQMVGRGLRLFPNKDKCIVLDFGSNWKVHGLVTDEREWGFNGKKKKDKIGAFPTKECPRCHSIMHVSAKICIDCGHLFEKPPAEINISEFVEIDNTTVLPKSLRNKKPEKMTIEELEIFRAFKGHKVGWIIYKIIDKANDFENFEILLKEYATIKKYKPNWVNYQLEQHKDTFTNKEL
jgi:DNA repair protein RadD